MLCGLDAGTLVFVDEKALIFRLPLYMRTPQRDIGCTRMCSVSEARTLCCLLEHEGGGERILPSVERAIDCEVAYSGACALYWSGSGD